MTNKPLSMKKKSTIKIFILLLTSLATLAVFDFDSIVNTVGAVSEPVAQDNISLLAGEYQYFTFSTPPGAVNAQLSGSVGVAGGVVPRILVYVMDESQCPLCRRHLI